MGYIEEYKNRKQSCENCIHKSAVPNRICSECYGYSFKDKLDLYSFIMNRVSEDSKIKFKSSDDGSKLFDALECKRIAYDKAKDEYDKAKDEYDKALSVFVEKEKCKINNAIDSLPFG